MTSATEWKFFLMAFKYMIGSWASDIKWSIAWRQRDMRRITLLYHHPTQEQLHTAYHIKWKKNILCMYDTQILLFSCPFHFNAHITPPGLTLDTCTKTVFFSCLKFFFFNVDHFKNLYWVCYNIASISCFGFLATRHLWA